MKTGLMLSLLLSLSSWAAIPDLGAYRVEYSPLGDVEAEDASILEWKVSEKRCDLRLPGEKSPQKLDWAPCAQVQAYLKKNWDAIGKQLKDSKPAKAKRLLQGPHAQVAELKIDGTRAGIRRFLTRSCDAQMKCSDDPHNALDDLGELLRKTVAGYLKD